MPHALDALAPLCRMLQLPQYPFHIIHANSLSTLERERHPIGELVPLQLEQSTHVAVPDQPTVLFVLLLLPAHALAVL